MVAVAYGNTITSVEITLDEARPEEYATSGLKPLHFLEEHTAAVLCYDNKVRPYPTNKLPRSVVGLFATTMPITRQDLQKGKMTAAVYTSGMASVKLEAGFVTDVVPGDVITLGYSGFEVFSPGTEKALNQTGFHVGKVLGFAATTNKENPIINIGSNKDKSESAMRADSIAVNEDL